MALTSTTSVFDFAGVAAFLAVIGAGLKWIYDNWGVRGADRDDQITAREQRYLAKVEERLRELDARVFRVERAYGAVLGVAHVMVDDLIITNPKSAALEMVRGQLRAAYPTQTDMPNELYQLAMRLEAHLGGKQT